MSEILPKNHISGERLSALVWLKSCVFFIYSKPEENTPRLKNGEYFLRNGTEGYENLPAGGIDI